MEVLPHAVADGSWLDFDSHLHRHCCPCDRECYLLLHTSSSVSRIVYMSTCEVCQTKISVLATRLIGMLGPFASPPRQYRVPMHALCGSRRPPCPVPRC